MIERSYQRFASPEEALQHFGVKGMHWGVRKDGTPGVPAKTDKEAKKDAAEFARAKMFYGEGAGTRRKLIKAKVESRSSRDAAYKKAFEAHTARQDLADHAARATKERKSKDRRAKTGRAIRGTRHVLNGNSQFATAGTALAVGGALAAHRSGIDRTIFNAAKTSVQNATRSQSNMRAAKQFLKDMGMAP